MKNDGTLSPELEKAEILETIKADIYVLKENNLNGFVYGFEKDIAEGIAESIKANGLIHPIVINKNNKIIAGHLRLEAYKLLDEADSKTENPSGQYKTILAEVRQFSTDGISEEEYFFISNEGRSRNSYQQLYEMEGWSRILRSEKYNHLSTGQKRDITIKRVGLGSQKTYYRAKPALDHIEHLRDQQGGEHRISKLLRRLKDKSWAEIEKIIKLEKDKPSTESLVEKDEKDLEQIIDDYELDVDVEDFEGDPDKMKGLRKAIAEELDLDLDEKKHKKEIGEVHFTYQELLRFNKYELFDLADRYSLGIDVKKFKKYKSSLLLSREIASRLQIETPDLTAKDLVSLNLDDLIYFSKQHNLGIQLSKLDDPYPIYLEEVAKHHRIDPVQIDHELSQPFVKKNYQKNFRSIRFGRLKMAIRKSRKKKLHKIEILTEKADKNIDKLAELITKIDSKSIKDLLELVNSSPNKQSDS